MADTSKHLSISSEFMLSYDHMTPSGSRHPQCLRNGLSNIGIDARQEKSTMIDLNLLCDRDYRYIFETSDDGWLVAGGDHTKLKRPDTAHAEIWRIGPDNANQGGISFDAVDGVMKTLAFGPMVMHPLRVNYTDSAELELLFEYQPDSTIGQLFAILSEVLKCPCGDYGNPFHITLVRGVKFRSESAKDAYFKQVDAVIEQWRKQYPQGIQFGDGGVDFFATREEILKHYPPQLETGVTIGLS